MKEQDQRMLGLQIALWRTPQYRELMQIADPTIETLVLVDPENPDNVRCRFFINPGHRSSLTDPNLHSTFGIRVFEMADELGVFAKENIGEGVSVEWKNSSRNENYGEIEVEGPIQAFRDFLMKSMQLQSDPG